MEAYFQVKADFIKKLTAPASALVNLDDPYGRQIAKRTDAEVIGYGLGAEATVRAEQVVTTMKKTVFDLISPQGRIPIRLNLIGGFNVYNALAAAAVGFSLGLTPETIRCGLDQLTGVPGRFELIPSQGPYTVVVDYAHTPDSLSNLLTTARQLVQQRLITVFGCGGNRDQGKRPLMGGIAAELSDYTIITNDNPRQEDPKLIAAQIREGFLTARPQGEYEMVLDRNAAIRKAVLMAKAGDMVVIAGKGPETYQDFGTYRVHFDDRESARTALKEKEEA
jgi:UDP-N-acetylmuramoyl-L-alanyl-D-glutamate--2,6-diaminopimelate ligase